MTELSRVLITGGCGYIGGRLAQHLARVSATRILLGTRKPRPAPDWLATASVVETPWASEASLEDACQGVDAIVHLAGMNAQDSADDPVGALESNGVATARLVRAAARCGVRRFIHVSTAHVYASPLRGAITEESRTTSLHPYATSHRAGEDAVLFAHQRQLIEGIAIRLSNSFGPPVSVDANCWMLLVNDLCRQAVTTRRMVLRSSGLQRRDFVTLTDACRAVAHLLSLDPQRIGNGLYNVGGAWAPTVLEMAERIAARCEQACGFTPRIERPQPQPDEAPDPLDFRIDKLLSSGLALVGDADAEIIGTLKLCAVSQVRP